MGLIMTLKNKQKKVDDIYYIEATDDGIKPNKKLKEALITSQFQLAMNGNADMLKWLGKQYLGQTDKAEANEYDNKPLPFID